MYAPTYRDVIDAGFRPAEPHKNRRSYYRGVTPEGQAPLGEPRPAPDAFVCSDCELTVWRADNHHSGRCLRCECARLRR